MKTKHKEILPKFKRLTAWNIKHAKAILAIFLLLSIPALYGNSHVDVYYNINKTLPETLDGVIANKELKEKYHMVSTQMVLVNKEMPEYQLKELNNKIEAVEGIEWVVSLAKIEEMGIPKEMIPQEILEILQQDNYQMMIINSRYEDATEESKIQIQKVKDIVKLYDERAIMAGEGPLMKDLVEIADHDFNSVTISSIAIIFLIMIFVFKSASIPVLLIITIEFAICFNMSVSCYAGIEIPFVASIVIGTIQLGATVDYAILMTTRYIEERKNGKGKKEAITIALENSIGSIVVSGLCFFAATCGVGFISKLEMIGSICTLISRGAIISMVVVITVLPALLLAFDTVIRKTTMHMQLVER